MVVVDSDIGRCPEYRHGIFRQNHHRDRYRCEEDDQIHPFPANAGVTLRRKVTPPVSERFRQPAAAADPGAISFAVEQNQDGNKYETKQRSPHDPDAVRISEKRIEEQRPGVDQAIGSPRIPSEGWVLRELCSQPLIFNQPLKQELRNHEEEQPLKTDQRNIAPDLKLVLTVRTPALHRLNPKYGNHGRVEHGVPERPRPVKECESLRPPSTIRPEFVAFPLLHSVDGIGDHKR